MVWTPCASHTALRLWGTLDAVAAAPSSFASATLPGLVHELKAHERALTELDEKLEGSLDELPKAIEEVLTRKPGRTRGVRDTLVKLVSDAETVSEQVETFNERIEQALKKSLQFNDVVRRQNDFKENLLPPEMFENSGTMVAHLKRAQQLGHSLLSSEAEKLVKDAKLQKLKFSSGPGPLVACAPCSLLASRWQRRTSSLYAFL